MDMLKVKSNIQCLEDGFYYYFPDKKCGLSASNLREIADYLDKVNKPLADSIDRYFKHTPAIK